MARQDLLGLTADDLIALSNRGTVKRAQREQESGEAGAQVSEDSDGVVHARWPDGAECRIRAKEKLSDRCCSCPATTICRHLVGTILAYQAMAARPAEAPAPESWDPGDIPDEALAAFWTARQLAAIRQQFDAGIVVELHRGSRPAARLHSLAHALRFLAQGDPRYTRCDCADPAPCRHVPLAIWAFRLLPKTRESGLVSAGREPPAATNLLADLDRALEQLLDYGIAGLPEALAARLEHLEAECRRSDLVWLAEILVDLLNARRQYLAHDARFSPSQVALLMGEMAIRADAARCAGQPVPAMFIRGSSSESVAEMGNARLIGLGTSVELRRKSVVVASYLQDAATGVVVAMQREFANPAEGEAPRSFHELGRTAVLKSANLTAVGSGQILIHGGKRSPNCEFLPGRARAVLNPQNYQWEHLRPPVMAADFADLVEQQSLRPHPCLCPRRLTENLHVCAIRAVEDARFDVREQCVAATLRDGQGQRAVLVHPYHSRGHSGAEALLHHLRKSKLLFAAGKVRLGGAGLVVSPTGLVFAGDDARWMLQPWLDEHAGAVADAPVVRAAAGTGLLVELLDLAGECALVGRRQVAPRLWLDLQGQCKSAGLVQIAEVVAPESALTLSVVVTWGSPSWRQGGVR